MRRLVLACLLLSLARAHAAAPEQRYLDLRDRYIAKFSAATNKDDSSRAHEAALEELATLLRALLGPLVIKGLPTQSRSNVDTLDRGDSGFGHLDGLTFSSDADKIEVVVTTTPLLKHWLREHREDGMPQEIGAAITSEQFYSSAIQDAAFAKYARLPIAKPASASAAIAVLGVRGNGELKGLPSEIDVVVMEGDRIYLVAVRDAIKTAAIPACERVWKDMMAKPVKANDPKGDLAREDQAMTAFTTCFAKAAPDQSWFASAVRKAQSQLDRLPLR